MGSVSHAWGSSTRVKQPRSVHTPGGFFLSVEAGLVTPAIKLRAFFVALVKVIRFHESARSRGTA